MDYDLDPVRQSDKIRMSFLIKLQRNSLVGNAPLYLGQTGLFLLPSPKQPTNVLALFLQGTIV